LGYNTDIHRNVTGNSLYSYLNKQKVSFYFLQKQNRRAEQVLPGGVGTSEREEDIGRECRRVKMVQILCIQVHRWKNEICGNYSMNGGEGIKENDGGVNPTMIYCKNFGKCHNVQPAQQQ
jgi:hypothetical protein